MFDEFVKLEQDGLPEWHVLVGTDEGFSHRRRSGEFPHKRSTLSCQNEVRWFRRIETCRSLRARRQTKAARRIGERAVVDCDADRVRLGVEKRHI